MAKKVAKTSARKAPARAARATTTRRSGKSGTKSMVGKAARRPAAKAGARKAPPSAKPASKRAGSADGVAQALRRQAIDNLKWCHASMHALAKDWPADRLTFQPSGSENHLMWTLGHLATFYSWAHSLVTGKRLPLPPEFPKLFGYGSRPQADAGAYPAFERVQQVHDESFDTLVAAFERLGPDELLAPPVENSHGTAETRLDVIHRTAWHDGWHQGQISALRRSLGLTGVL